MASGVLDFLPDLKSAETPKDLSRWYSKRVVLHDIYILQGKSLSDVKKIMESDHGFPKTLKPSDYEHVLREEFKFRKNLSADEWRLSIGPRIERRRAAGKRSEVLLNGSKIQNVDRRIERSLKSKRSRRLAKAHNAALPYGLIIRTPSPRPSTLIACSDFDTGLGDIRSKDRARHQSPVNAFGNSSAETHWLSLLMDAIPIPESASRETLVLSAHLLRDGCPINKFLNLLNNHQLELNQAYLRLFGPNTSIDILGKMCFDFSNKPGYEALSHPEMRSILDWVGSKVDIAVLTTFLSQKSFTILAVWEALVRVVDHWNHSAAFDALLSVHLSIKDRVPWTMKKPFYDLLRCLSMAPSRAATVIHAYSCDKPELDEALYTTTFRSSPIESVKQLISAGASFNNGDDRANVDWLIRVYARQDCEAFNLPLVESLLEAGAVMDDPLLDNYNQGWCGPNDPLYSTDYFLLKWGHSTNNEGVWSRVSLYSDRQQTTITVPGIFGAAESGQEQLHSYLNARSKPFDNQDRKAVLEIALSEASGRGYANVVESLVQFGVDLNVRMLRRPRRISSQAFQNIWHPVVRAVNSGHLHILRILVSKASADIVFWEGRVEEQLDLCSLRNMENSQRGQILQVLSALDISTECRSGVLLCAIGPHHCGQPGHEAPDYGFVSQLLELGLACLDCRQYFEGKASHVLVQAIQKKCNVRSLNYLVQKDVEVLYGLSADTNRELLEVTISRFGCERHKILAFFAQNIEGFRSCAEENAPSLLSCLFKHKNCSHLHYYSRVKTNCECGHDFMITLKWFLDLGVHLYRSVLNGPTLDDLVKYADDHSMLAMIHSMADVSTIDGWNALRWSILFGRLNLAVVLIERGAQVNDTREWDRNTTLQRACEEGAPLWFIKFLVEKGEDVNAPPDSYSEEGCTALQAACLHGAQLSCISFLIEMGADVNAPPNLYSGLTALQYAAREGRMNIAGFLLDHGADVNALSGLDCIDPDFRFKRALDLAAEKSRLDMAHFLIAAGARSSEPGCTGFKGAIEIAKGRGNFAIASLIQEHADSGSGERMEAEKMWLRANSHACVYNGKIQGATWVAFVKRAGGEDDDDVYNYLTEQWGESQE